MANEATDGYALRQVPFDEWADMDTLIHRTSASSGDFDYMLRPRCPECDIDLALEYEDLPEGVEALAAVTCDDCKVMWRMAPAQGDPST